MKTISFVCLFNIALASQMLCAGQIDSRGDDPEVKVKVEKLLGKIQSQKRSSYAMSFAISDLREMREKMITSLSLETKKEVAIRLGEVYRSLGDVPCEAFTKKEDFHNCLHKQSDNGDMAPLMHSACKKNIIEVIGLGVFGTEAAKDFFKEVLKGKNEYYRSEALWTMYYKHIQGDDMYDLIEGLISNGTIKTEEAYGALRGANPRRAAKGLQEYIRTTTDRKQFIRHGSLLSEYRDPDLMDVVVERYDYFKNNYASDGDPGGSPTFAFQWDVLVQYVAAKDGAKLKKALEIMDDCNVFGKRQLPVMAEKLKSKDPDSRSAVIDFLGRQVSRGVLGRADVIPMFNEAYRNETNAGVKKKLDAILKKV